MKIVLIGMILGIVIYGIVSSILWFHCNCRIEYVYNITGALTGLLGASLAHHIIKE